MKKFEKKESTSQADLVSLKEPKISELESVLMFYDNGLFELRSASSKGLGPVIPFSQSYLQSVHREFNVGVKKEKAKKTQVAIGGKIPENLLYASSITERAHAVIWKEPAGSHFLKWDKGEHDGEYYFPNMIMGLLSGSIVLLIEINGKYYPPSFPNFHSKGTMCHGSVSVKFKPKMTWDEMIQYGRAAFFDTMFSHQIKGTMFAQMFNKKEFTCKLPKPLTKKQMKELPLLSWL